MASRAVNPLVDDVGSPPIPEAKAWLQRYDGSHGLVIDLSQAVPGDPPPPSLREAMAQAAGSAEGAKYGPIQGDAALRDAYAAHLADLYGGDIGAADVAITAGCNLAFVITAMLLARHGDAVILPTPWYFNYQMTLAMLGIEARPLPCRTEAGFVPDPEDLLPLLDGRVRAVVLVSPNNPTGAVYPASVIARFAEICAERGIWLVVDETYRDFLPPDLNRPHGLFAAPDWRDHVIGLYSFSKAYCIPGHRLGAITAGASLQSQIGKIVDCLQICPPRTAQLALPAAISDLAEWRHANRFRIHDRAGVFRAAMAEVPEWRVESIGAYFAYVRHPFAGRSGRDVAEALATERGVLALPGSYFGPGQEGHLRFAFANVGAEVISGLAQRLAGFAI